MKKNKRTWNVEIGALLTAMLVAGCGGDGGEEPGKAGAAPVPPGAVKLELVYSSEKQTWMEEQLRPQVWSPASGAYVEVLNAAWIAR